MSYSALVLGCNKHNEIAKKYFALANKFWPESLNRTIFCTDIVSDDIHSFCNRFAVGVNQSYKSRLVEGLKQCENDYVLVMLDDYYITKKINDDDFAQLINNLKKDNIAYCRLIGIPKCFKNYKKIKKAKVISKKRHYGVSLQPSIWKKDVLLRILEGAKGDSAWETEVSLRVVQNKDEKCICFNKNILHIKNGVLRGKLFPYTNRILKRNGIEQLRLEKISYFKYAVFIFKQKISGYIPSCLRRTFKKIATKFGANYYTDD